MSAGVRNWYTKRAPVDIGIAGILSRGEWALKVFQDLGATVNLAGRLPSALRRLRTISTSTTWAQSASIDHLRVIAEAERTIWEFFVIAFATDGLKGMPNTPFAADMITTALSGAELPGLDKRAKGRSTQFELYVAAHLALGGIDVRRHEPDLVIRTRDGVASVAVKRMNSLAPNKLEERILEARDQIARWPVPGYIAVNIDVLFANSPGMTVDVAVHHATFDAGVRHVDRVIEKHFESEHLLDGFLVFGHLDGWDLSLSPPLHITAYPLSRQLFVDPEAPARSTRLTEFWAQFLDNMEGGLAFLRSGKVDG
jgi:hypothetical protein